MPKTKKEELTVEEKLQLALLKDEDKLYDVPENWVWTRLGTIATIISGGTPSTSVEDYYLGGEISWITPADLSNYDNVFISHGKRNITEKGLKGSSARLLPKNSVLLSSRAPIGYVAIANNILCTNQGFKSFLPSPCYIPKFLYYYLKYSRDTLQTYASGTTFLELSGSKVAQVPFPQPPLPEQHRIVDTIERLFGKLDRAKELLQSALDTFANRKAAILHQAFIGELTAKWREENGVGLDSWENCKLEKYINTQYGYTESANNDKVGPKFLRITDIQDDKVCWETVPYCLIETEKFATYSLKINDIVVARTGATTGKSYLISDKVEAVFASYLIRVTIERKIVPKFLIYFTQSLSYWNQITNFSQGIAQPGVNATKLKELKINLPTIQEQKEIVRILDNILENEQKSKDLCDMIEKIDLMKKSILARAFRGELGTNDPNEESSIELLKECLKQQ